MQSPLHPAMSFSTVPGATEFSPDAGMTRGMLAAVLSNFERGRGPAIDAAFERCSRRCLVCRSNCLGS